MNTKNGINKLIMITISIYIIVYSFSGVFTRLAINFNVLGIKKVLPEILIFILLFIVFIKIILENRIKTDVLIAIVIMYFTCKIIGSLYSGVSLNQIIFTLRDIYIPFFMLVIILNINFNHYEKKKLIKSLNGLMLITVLAGLILACIQIAEGWEWSSKFYTGYSFYGIDELTGIKISHINWLLRPPTITGNHVTFGILSVFAAFIFIEYSSYKKSKLSLIKNLICIVNVFLSTSRTAIVMIFILYGYYFISKDKLKKNSLIVPILILISVGILYINSTTLLSTSSFMERINNAWFPILHDLSVKDFILGKNIYNVGQGLKFAESYYSYDFLVFGVFDNMYLYLLASYGIIGVTLFLALMGRIAVLAGDKYFKGLTYAVCISGIFTNLFQGRAVFYIYFILFSIIKNNENKIKRGEKYRELS